MNENLISLYEYAFPIHKGLMHLILTLLVVYLLLSQFGVATKNYVLRIRYFLPIYHGILSVSIFSGILLLAALDFSLSPKIVAMIVGAILLIGLSAVGFKRLKLYAKQKELFNFRRFALFQGIAEIIIVLVIGIGFRNF